MIFGEIIFKSNKAKGKETGDTLKNKKRKLEENEKENNVKRPKIRKSSSNNKNNRKSPELNDTNVSIPLPIKKGTPVSRNLLTKKVVIKIRKLEEKE